MEIASPKKTNSNFLKRLCHSMLVASFSIGIRSINNRIIFLLIINILRFPFFNRTPDSYSYEERSKLFALNVVFHVKLVFCGPTPFPKELKS